MKNCAVCGIQASHACSRCSNATYCSREHQKQAWSEHKIVCHEAFQIGIWACGQIKTVTPVFVPISSGKIEMLPRDKIAKLIPCLTQHLKIIISPFSALFGPDHHIVCAFNGGSPSSRSEAAEIPIYSTRGDVCYHAVHMTRSLVHSWGSQIHGNAVFFYLKPKKDFLADVDFKAVQNFISEWDDAEQDCSNTTLRRLTKKFETNLTNLSSKSTGKVDCFDVFVFPALEGKPFITRHPFRYIPSDDQESLACHSPVTGYILGDTFRSTADIIDKNTRSHYTVFFRDEFLKDCSPLNQSIIQATKGMATHPWAGNIIVSKSDSLGNIAVDVHAKDLKTIIDYFAAVYGPM